MDACSCKCSTAIVACCTIDEAIQTIWGYPIAQRLLCRNVLWRLFYSRGSLDERNTIRSKSLVGEVRSLMHRHHGRIFFSEKCLDFVSHRFFYFFVSLRLIFLLNVIFVLIRRKIPVLLQLRKSLCNSKINWSGLKKLNVDLFCPDCRLLLLTEFTDRLSHRKLGSISFILKRHLCVEACRRKWVLIVWIQKLLVVDCKLQKVWNFTRGP